MLQLERTNDKQDTLLFLFDNLQAGIYTQGPGICISWDADNDTVVVQPAIKMLRQDRLGNRTWLQLPELQDVPVVRQRSGGCALTFPINPGDECLISWANRCIDAWWQSGGVQQQSVMRMHDLSDGFAFFGPASLPKSITNISKTTTQLRSIDGTTYVELDPAGAIVNVVANKGINMMAAQGKITMTALEIDQTTTVGSINLTSPMEVNLVTPVTDISGALAAGTGADGGNATFNGTVTAAGEGTFAGVGVDSHTHGYLPGSGSETQTTPGTG